MRWFIFAMLLLPALVFSQINKEKIIAEEKMRAKHALEKAKNLAEEKEADELLKQAKELYMKKIVNYSMYYEAQKAYEDMLQNSKLWEKTGNEKGIDYHTDL